MSVEAVSYLYQFFGLWQITIGFFAFMALWAIWGHITKDQDKGEKDKGLMWLSFAVLIWAFSGVVDVFHAHQLKNSSELTEFDNSVYEGLRSMLSIINSALILLALPCFKHIPRSIGKFVKSDAWLFIVGTTFFICTAVSILMITKVIIPSKAAFIYSVDFIYAMFTLSFLGLILWESFEKRGIKLLAYLSVVSIACTLIAQVLKLNLEDTVFWGIFFSCAFKTILIMLFFALALSWVKEMTKNYFPQPDEMHLFFIQKKIQTNKYNYQVILTIPPHIQTQAVSYTEKPFSLFLSFAEARKKANNDPKLGWLEIQPKSYKTGDYDIKDYNEINRLLDPILNSSFGLDNWTSEVERSHLKKVLFAYQKNRKIKLRVHPSNIHFEKK